MWPVFPQAWPFFTKPADDSEITAYLVEDGVITNATDFPNSLPANAFGFSRTQRAQGPELANLSFGIPIDKWQQCEDVLGDCVLAANREPALQVKNNSTLPTLCGVLTLAETEPVPWEFRHHYAGWRIDVQTVTVDVKCG